ADGRREATAAGERTYQPGPVGRGGGVLHLRDAGTATVPDVGDVAVAVPVGLLELLEERDAALAPVLPQASVVAPRRQTHEGPAAVSRRGPDVAQPEVGAHLEE